MGMFSKPKAPKKTAEQEATEIRTRSLLDKEIADEEELFKMMASKKLGRASLLSGSPRTAKDAAGGKASVGGDTGNLGGNTKSPPKKRPSSIYSGAKRDMR